MQDTPVDTIQDDSGRWRWVVPSTPAEGACVSFRTREDAVADFEIHARAPRDGTGRRVLSKQYLRKLVSALALPCAACADVFFGGVYWYRRDEEGCNWGVAIMNGAGDHAGCLACMHAGKAELRRRYSIADEA